MEVFVDFHYLGDVCKSLCSSRIRLQNPFLGIAYSQLQLIVFEKHLGDINYYFQWNFDFRKTVRDNKIPNPTNFIEQPVSFCQVFI